MSAVDVLLPVKGPAPFLNDALRSVAWQTHRNVRVVLVDDGLTDADRDVIDRHRRTLRIDVFDGPTTGIVGALNAGIVALDAPFVARHDADDVMHPDRLARHLSLFARRRAASFSGVGARFVDENGLLIRWHHAPPNDDEVDARLLRGNAFVHPAMAMRTAALRELGGYRNDWPLNEDYDLWLRAAERFQFANDPRVLVTVRVHPQSSSRTSAKLQIQNERARARVAQAMTTHSAPTKRAKLVDDVATMRTLLRVSVVGPVKPRALVAPFQSVRPVGPPPTVGVVIPARNMEATLRDTLASIAAQTSPPDRVVLVDDGSTDATVDIAKSSGVVDVVVRGPARGLSAARNVGFDVCTTDYVVPLDADDLVEPDWIARVRGIAHRAPRSDIIAGTWIFIHEDGTRLSPRHRMGPLDPERLWVRNTMPSSGMGIRRQRLLDAGGYDETVMFAEDWQLWQRLAASAVVAFVDAPAYRVRLRTSSMLRGQGIFENIELARPRVAGAPPALKDEANATLLYEGAVRALASGRQTDARRLLVDAMKTKPTLLTKIAPALLLSALPTSTFNDVTSWRQRVRHFAGAFLDDVLPAPLGTSKNATTPLLFDDDTADDEGET